MNEEIEMDRTPSRASVVSLRNANANADEGSGRMDPGGLVVFEDVVERTEGGFGDAMLRSRHWETVRALRTELLLRRVPQDGCDAIAVIGTAAGDGRSVLAADLAMSFAQMGLRTLLVDADLRAPRQHALFGTNCGPGLSDAVMQGQAPMLHTVRSLPCMYLLTAGSRCEDPLEVLSGQAMQRMVAFWKRIFDVVVIDTPPAARFTDPVVVASWENTRTLLVTRAQRTAQRDLDELVRRLAALRAPVAGAVVNHF